MSTQSPRHRVRRPADRDTHRPLNTASTEKDVAHVLNLVRPTHVAITESQMETVQRAAASVASVNPKIFTVLSKTGNIPRVSVIDLHLGQS